MVLQGLSRFKRNLHRMVGSRSLKVRSWFASSDLNVVSLGVSRLEFACISLQAKLHLDSILSRSLKRKTSRFKRSFIWAVQKFMNFLTLSSKNPILIPRSPKTIFYNVYRFYMQHSTQSNTETCN